MGHFYWGCMNYFDKESVDTKRCPKCGMTITIPGAELISLECECENTDGS